MENILTVVNGVGWFMAALGAAVAVFFVAYSGYLFISAQGDPQRMAQARGSLIGVAVGLVVIGGAFIIPGTISRFVIEPAGGVPVNPRTGFDCDGLLKDQLIIQRNASNPDRMQFVIRWIQSRRSECDSESWSPVVRTRRGHPQNCLARSTKNVGEDVVVGEVAVPGGLMTSGSNVKNISGRDSDNNIIVYWTVPEDAYALATGLPSDGAICWLYISALGAWTESYHEGAGRTAEP